MAACPLLVRLEPLISGAKKAEDFLEELITAALQDFSQRLLTSVSIPADQLHRHAQATKDSMAGRYVQRSSGCPCKALTKNKRPCKAKAQAGSDFCHRHRDKQAKMDRRRAAMAIDAQYLADLNAAAQTCSENDSACYRRGLEESSTVSESC